MTTTGTPVSGIPGPLSPLRSRPAVRRFLEGPALAPSDLSLVMLVAENSSGGPMPTVTVRGIPAVVREAARLGVRSVKFFAESPAKDTTGRGSLSPDSLMARAIAAAKETEPSLAVMTETCLCSYTEDGTCYITDRQRRPDLVATLAVTSAQAVAHADAGADIVGPASMVPGVTRGVRAALNESGHTTVGVMPHVIFRSSLYEGYRRTMGAAPRPGADREFQVGTSKPNQFIEVALRHVEEGADMLLLEPALFCVDVLVALKARALVPVMPFSVSGEYTMLTRPDSVTGKRDTRVLAELFTMLKRAGADATITYAALDLARTLPGGG